jgi:hypothetical protein
MLGNSKRIEVYGKGIENFDLSPFESIHLLHIRSNLEKVFHELTHDERIKLLSYDLKLIQNAKRMAKHIGSIYDFRLSKEPISQFWWWWHLDRVAKGEITFTLKAEHMED